MYDLVYDVYLALVEGLVGLQTQSGSPIPPHAKFLAPRLNTCNSQPRPRLPPILWARRNYWNLEGSHVESLKDIN